MIYKYEMACKEAGLSEEQTAEIRRFFDAEKKKLNRRKASLDKSDVILVFADSEEYGEDGLEIPDSDTDVETEVLRRMEIEELRGYLAELPEMDRDILLTSYSGLSNCNAILMERYGLIRGKLQYRREKLFHELQEKYREKYEF